MSETFNITPVIPGAETPEGRARIQREVDQRHDVDFRAFRMLRRLKEDGFLTYHGFLQYFKEDLPDDEAKEFAQELDEEIRAIIRDRLMADHYVLQALAGRPDDREGR